MTTPTTPTTDAPPGEASKSSPPSAPLTGPQDCSTCVRRRIRCDRSLPTCFKCSKKSLACPGYGPRLRWANGIAVRGHLKGRTTPNIDKPVRARASPKESSKESSKDSSPKSVKSSESNSILGLSSSSNADPLEKWFPDFPDAITKARLLAHYDRNIAGLMVWIDSDKNEYRRLILPLADRQPVLLLAILAISDQHLAVTGNVESNFSVRARDAAVEMISKHIRQVTGRLADGHDLGNEIDVDTAIWMLASMLTLASYEMAESEAGAAAADSHRQAARTLVNALATTNRENNDLFNFLRNQLSIYDILACTTSFNPMSTGEAIMPAPDHQDIIFSEYLAILHRVTVLSRQVSHSSASGSSSPAERAISPAEVRSRFELARGSTLMAAGWLELPRNQRRRDFIRIVDIYHHSALLYTYRCIFPGKIDPADVNASTTALFERLGQLEERSSCMQNLPWPVFIAGTECCGQPERQMFIAKLYEDIARDMGFKHYLEILHFLKDLWSSESGDWLHLARAYGLNGQQIVAV